MTEKLEFIVVHKGGHIISLLSLTDLVGIEKAIKNGLEATKMVPDETYKFKAD